MRKKLKVRLVRKIFMAALALVIAVFLTFITATYFNYVDVLTQNIELTTEKNLLSNFDFSKFKTANDRLKKRRDTQDPAPDLPDPFGQVEDN